MTGTKRSAYQGYIDLTLAQVGMAINVVVAKCAMPLLPMYFYMGIRSASIALMLSIFLRYQGVYLVAREHPMRKLSRRDWGLLWATAMCGGPLFNILMMLGVSYTTATSAGIVMSALPAMLLMFSFWLLGEALNLPKVAAILLAVVGLVILGLDDSAALESGKNSLFGNILIFLAVVPQALYSILSKLLHSRVSILGIGLAVNALSALVLLPLSCYEAYYLNFNDVDPLAWKLLLITVLCGTMFNWLWGRGLSTVPGGTAAIFTGVMPVATSIIAMIFLGEQLNRYDCMGMLFVLLSIFIGTRRRHHAKAS